MTPSGTDPVSSYFVRRLVDPIDRLRAVGFFVIAIVFDLFATSVAGSAANGLSGGIWNDLTYRTVLLLLLLVGYGAMGIAFQGQRRPLQAMGLTPRPGAGREFGTGLAVGWALMAACVLPIAIFGRLIITLWTTPGQFAMLALDLVTLAVAALLEEVVFRGYPFQRLIEAIGEKPATLILSTLFALWHRRNPDASLTSTLVTLLAGWLLAMAYLRTRALWLGWGLHLGWNASMALLFGLPLSGLQQFSPVIQSSARGPLWLTGGLYGPEGGWVAVVVLLVGMAVLYRVTDDLAYRYAQPEIIPGGYPVDISAAAQNQHDTAMASPAAQAAPALVQILPASPASPSVAPRSESDVASTGRAES